MTDWSKIVEEHGPIVWRAAKRLLRNEADTADCFQRTFISALELARTETIRHWPAVLKKLATARALDQLRKSLRERKHLVTESEEAGVEFQLDPKAISADEQVITAEMMDQMRVALAEMDANQAQAFCLTYFEKLSYQEIAEQLDVTEKRVGVLLGAAKEILRKKLRAYDPLVQSRSEKPEVKQ
jgi:RNA polymerase sigma-70 factor (ECF subfamily)